MWRSTGMHTAVVGVAAALGTAVALASNDTMVATPADTSFAGFSGKFREYHQETSNVFGHLVTVPLGIFALASLVNALTRSTFLTAYLAALYAATLLDHVPLEIFGLCCATLLLLLTAARMARLSVTASVSLLLAAYAGQEAVHFMSREATYAESYSNAGSEWASLFLEHCYYLLPLCFDAVAPLTGADATFFDYHSAPESLLAARDHLYWLLPLLVVVAGNFAIDSDAGFAPAFVENKRMLHCNMSAPEERADLASIRSWAMSHDPVRDTSSHWWYTDLDSSNRSAFDRLTSCDTIMNMFYAKFHSKDYVVEPLPNMNEVYVTGPVKKQSSDTVFYTEHIDGPWGLYPFASVYRCIVGMDDNDAVTTHFPVSEFKKAAKTGDVLAFDFNREVHYITRDEEGRTESDGFRVVLKFHYCMYPKSMTFLGKGLGLLNVGYNMLFRALFLATISPDSIVSKIGAFFVVHVTELVNAMWLYVGPHNALYVLGCALTAHAFGRYHIFLAATSFLHYCRYIGTYYYRGEVNYGNFKRDVLFFKTIAVVQLVGLYLLYFFDEFNALAALSLSMIVAGYAVSALATKALGMNLTYFGIELGRCEPVWIDSFPYGYIPHPMITGQLFAMVGLMLNQNFMSVFPWLTPIHMTFYTVHMLQEAFDIHAGEGGNTPKTKLE